MINGKSDRETEYYRERVIERKSNRVSDREKK